MLSSFLRLSAVAMVPAVLAGCGGGMGGTTGGGGGGGANPTSVTFTFSGGTPTAVAAKIGSGAFASETLSNNSLNLSIPSGTMDFAVAYVCPPQAITSGGTQIGQIVNQRVIEASTSDGTSFGIRCLGGTAVTPPTTGTLTGKVDVSALSGTSFFSVSALGGGGESSETTVAAKGDFSFQAPAGSDRVQVLAFGTILNGVLESFSLLGAKNFDGLTVPGALNGGDTVALGAADATTNQSITYNGVPSGFGAPSSLVLFEYGEGGGFVAANAAGSQYPALPAAAVKSGDFYVFSAIASNPSVIGEAVLAFASSRSGGPISITLPAAWSYGGPSPAAWPTFDMTYSGFSNKADAVYTANTGWSTTGSSQNLYEVSASGNFQNGSTTLMFPDLSGLTGFLAAPASGKTVAWAAEVQQNTTGFLQPAPAGSASGSAAANAGSFTVP